MDKLNQLRAVNQCILNSNQLKLTEEQIKKLGNYYYQFAQDEGKECFHDIYNSSFSDDEKFNKIWYSNTSNSQELDIDIIINPPLFFCRL